MAADLGDYWSDFEGWMNNLRTFRTRTLYQLAVLLALLLIVGVPFVFFVWGSFWSTAPGLGGHFTLDAYAELFTPSVYETVWNTLIVATVGSVLAVVLGVGAAVIVGKTDMPLKHIFASVFLIQYLLPDFVIAFGWEFYVQGDGSLVSVLLGALGIDVAISIYNVWGIALVTGIYYSGLVYLLTVSAVEAIPAELEEAARISGANAWTIVRRIIFRLSLPSILIAFILVYTRLVQSFGVPLILGLPRRVYVVATRMYIALTAGYPPEFAFAAAMGMVILLAAMAGVVVQNRITGATEKYEVIGAGSGSVMSATMKLGKYRYPTLGVVGIIMFLFFILPTLVIAVSSVQNIFTGFDGDLTVTFVQYEKIFFGAWSADFWAAMINTLIIAILGAFVGMFLASVASYIIIKSDSPLAGFIDFLTISPIAVPGIILAMSFMWIFLTYNFLGLYQTIWIIILAFTSRFIVIGTRASNSAFRSISSELEEAAQINGANLLTILRKIYWPLIRPGFISGFALLAIIYMKVLSIPILLQGGRENLVLAVMLWKVRNGGEPEIASAVAVVMMVLVGTGYILMTRFANVNLTRV